MAVTWTTTDRAAQFNGVKVLVHGRAGSGKTPLALTAPAPLMIAAEAGLLSVRNQSVPTAIVKSLADMEEVYQYLIRPGHQFQTACLDSVSEIAEVTLAAEKAKNKDPRKAYGNMQDDVIAMLRKFRDLPMNIYFSCKQDRIKDEFTGQTLYGPWMPGQQLGKALPYMFDEIFSLEVAIDQQGNPFSYLRTRRDPLYEARDRSYTLDPFERPDLSYIFAKIAAGVTR